MERVEVDTMREYFAKVIDTVNDLAGQAGLVSGLQEQVNNLITQVSQLQTELANTRNAVNEANSRISQLEAERDHYKSRLENETAVSQGLRDTIVQRDTTVTQLEGSYRSEVDAHRITKADLDDSRRATGEQEARANDYQQRLNSTVQSLEEWRARANDYQNRCNELQIKLDRVMAVLNPPLHIVGDGGGQAQVG